MRKELISMENSKWIRHHVEKNKAKVVIVIKKREKLINLHFHGKTETIIAVGVSDNGLNHAIEKCRKDFNKQFDINTIY